MKTEILRGSDTNIHKQLVSDRVCYCELENYVFIHNVLDIGNYIFGLRFCQLNRHGGSKDIAQGC